MGKKDNRYDRYRVCAKCGRRLGNGWLYKICYYCEPRYKADMQWRYTEGDLTARYAVYNDIDAIRTIKNSLDIGARVHVMPVYPYNVLEGYAVVAEKEGRLVGWARLDAKKRFVLYVPPHERQKGVGGFLVRALQSRYPYLVAYVDAVHDWKINFFVKYGFRYAFTEIRRDFRLRPVVKDGGRRSVYKDVVNYVMVWRRDYSERPDEASFGCIDSTAEQPVDPTKDLQAGGLPAQGLLCRAD